jgi:hypothetical protein
MRVSSPSSSSRVSTIALLLVALATIATLTGIVVAVTGGFTLAVDIGGVPLRLSSHDWRDPAVAAAVSWALLLVLGREHAVRAGESVLRFIDQSSATIAFLLAVATLGIGMGYGTYSAAGADASGYVSQAAAIGSGSLVRREPLASTVPWTNATWAFSPLGYRPGPSIGEIVPTYPIGLPLTMAPVAATGEPLAVFLVVPLLGAVAVFSTYVLGVKVHSPRAGLTGAVLLATSPIFLFQLVQPMSDVPVTAWWTLAVLLALSERSWAPLAAGGVAGLAILTRPNLAPLALVVVIALLPTVRGRARALLPAAAGVCGAVALLLWRQWQLYGNPVTSGYGDTGDLFSLSSIWPNAVGYASRLVSSEAPALTLLVIGAFLAARHLHRRHRQGLLLAVATGAIVVACYLPYGVFAEWSYLRFLLPAFSLLFVATGLLFAGALDRVPAGARGIGLLLTLALAGSANVVTARHEQAFRLRDYEARYRTVGRYLAEALPANAVVITSQQSGGVHHYTGRPVVRWDLLDETPDAIVETLRALGREPVIVAEDWELPVLRSKFADSPVARLDWQPRARFVGTTAVSLFDPRDRLASAASVDVLR